MKKHPFLKGMVATSLIASFVAIGLPAHADFDLDGLNQQVQNQGTELNNHEQRIDALENQNKTDAPKTDSGQSSNQTALPVDDSTPAPTSDTPAPTNGSQPVTEAPPNDPPLPPSVAGYTPPTQFGPNAN